uniref:HPr family phosphocarrier protein n=1 Tax=Bacillus thuringiensis TaxID=1428 RepID=UPI0011AAEFEF
RPTTLLLNTASKFASHIDLHYNAKNLNLKSIIPLISLPIQQRPQIKITPNPHHPPQPLPPIQQTMKNQPVPQ